MVRCVIENLNPAGKSIGDCTVRAIAKATNKPWDTVYTGLCAEGYKVKDMPSSNAVWGKYLRRCGFKRHALPSECPDCYTVEQFCEDHPSGTYVLALQSHVVAVIDGQYYDTWDSGQEPPIYFWERSDQ